MNLADGFVWPTQINHHDSARDVVVVLGRFRSGVVVADGTSMEAFVIEEEQPPRIYAVKRRCDDLVGRRDRPSGFHALRGRAVK